MGTDVTVLLPATPPETAGRVQRLFDEWESVLSRFLSDSELSFLNRHGGNPMRVGDLLWSVLDAALEAAGSTDGIYDPTMLRQLETAGYDRTFDEVRSSQAAASRPASAGGAWRLIRRDRSRRLVTLPNGVGLDFGGIAKGMAVDAAIELLAADGLQPAAVEAGGDLRVLGVPLHANGWQVAITLPTGHQTVTLRQGAIATSSRSYRRWLQGAEEQHHILDPRSGVPARSGLWSVTVTAARCVQADVAAKTAFILGLDRGGAFLSRNRLSGLFVSDTGEMEPAGDWPVHSGDSR
jgi:thiamine biosynthesis lipoprotein